jgi:transposase InsO family protein
VADLIFRGIVCQFGLPTSIVSDRDSKFTKAFWSQLFSKCGTRLRFSSVFHPQTDGITERLNKTLEELLRCQCVLSQEDWDVLLPYVEFAYNNSPQASSKFSPFFVDIGRHPLCPIGRACLHRWQAVWHI